MLSQNIVYNLIQTSFCLTSCLVGEYSVSVTAYNCLGNKTANLSRSFWVQRRPTDLHFCKGQLFSVKVSKGQKFKMQVCLKLHLTVVSCILYKSHLNSLFKYIHIIYKKRIKTTSV